MTTTFDKINQTVDADMNEKKAEVQWKLVPVEPTEEMRDAGNVEVKSRATLFAAWHAMLAAAPVPPAGDVEVLGYLCEGHDVSYFSTKIQHGMKNTKLADRAHVTRLAAERDGLLVEVERLTKAEDNQRARVGRAHALLDERQSELTKARELLGRIAEYAPTGICAPTAVQGFAIEAVRLLAHQPAPAATCGRCEASTVEHCDEKGCGYLASGNGAPTEKGEADE